MGVSIAQIEAGSCTTLSAFVLTLSDLLCALGPKSPCLCCGAPLAPPLGDQEELFLRCPRCGAEVEVCEDSALQRAA
jgi:hypothetical protein